MKKTFYQIKKLVQTKHKLLTIKKNIVNNVLKENIFESWFFHSSGSSIGYEFDFPHNY